MATWLSQEEFQVIEDIRQRQQNALMELGQIELIKLDLGRRRENVERFIDQTKELEFDFSKKLEAKYGKGIINLETGEYIASPKETPTLL